MGGRGNFGLAPSNTPHSTGAAWPNGSEARPRSSNSFSSLRAPPALSPGNTLSPFPLPARVLTYAVRRALRFLAKRLPEARPPLAGLLSKKASPSSKRTTTAFCCNHLERRRPPLTKVHNTYHAKAMNPTLFVACAMSEFAQVDFGSTNICASFGNQSHPSFFSEECVTGVV